MFRDLESAPQGTKVPLSTILDNVPFNSDGLIPAIAQDADTKEVLMLAWMDREALETTLRDGAATYYSRSRKTQWRKGETSGHTQEVVSCRLDCDGDTVLLSVKQVGPACHTNRRSCFYFEITGDSVVVTTNPD